MIMAGYDYNPENEPVLLGEPAPAPPGGYDYGAETLEAASLEQSLKEGHHFDETP